MAERAIEAARASSIKKIDGIEAGLETMSTDIRMDQPATAGTGLLCLAGPETTEVVRQAAARLDIAPLIACDSVEHALTILLQRPPLQALPGGPLAIVAALGTTAESQIISLLSTNDSPLLRTARELHPRALRIVYSHTACADPISAAMCKEVGADAVINSSDALSKLLLHASMVSSTPALPTSSEPSGSGVAKAGGKNTARKKSVRTAQLFNPRPPSPNYLLLIGAAIEGDVAKVRELLEDGADKDGINENHTTALMRAARAGHIAVVKLLVEHGATLDHTSLAGTTALIEAAVAGHAAAVQVLLDSGADWRLKDAGGCTALDWAHKKGNTAVVAVLSKFSTDKPTDASRRRHHTVPPDGNPAPSDGPGNNAKPWLPPNTTRETRTELSPTKYLKAAVEAPPELLLQPEPAGAPQAEQGNFGLLEELRGFGGAAKLNPQTTTVKHQPSSVPAPGGPDRDPGELLPSAAAAAARMARWTDRSMGAAAAATQPNLEIIVGNTCVPKNKIGAGASKQTYSWCVYVRAVDHRTEFRQVRFMLHEDTFENPERVVDTPPFEVKSSGWGEFEVIILIKMINGKQATIKHLLELTDPETAWQITLSPDGSVGPKRQLEPEHRRVKLRQTDPRLSRKKVLTKKEPRLSRKAAVEAAAEAGRLRQESMKPEPVQADITPSDMEDGNGEVGNGTASANRPLQKAAAEAAAEVGRLWSMGAEPGSILSDMEDGNGEVSAGPMVSTGEAHGIGPLVAGFEALQESGTPVDHGSAVSRGLAFVRQSKRAAWFSNCSSPGCNCSTQWLHARDEHAAHFEFSSHILRPGDLDMLGESFPSMFPQETAQEIEAAFQAWSKDPVGVQPILELKGGSSIDFRSMVLTGRPQWQPQNPPTGAPNRVGAKSKSLMSMSKPERLAGTGGEFTGAPEQWHHGHHTAVVLRAATTSIRNPQPAETMIGSQVSADSALPARVSTAVLCHGLSSTMAEQHVDSSGLPQWYWASDLVSTSNSGIEKSRSRSSHLQFQVEDGSRSLKFKWVQFDPKVQHRLERAYKFSVSRGERICVRLDDQRFVDVAMLLVRECANPDRRRQVMRVISWCDPDSGWKGVAVRPPFDAANASTAATTDATRGVLQCLSTEATISNEIRIPKLIQALGQATEDFYLNLLTTGQKKMSHSKLVLLGPGRVGKTSLLRALSHQEFDPEEPSTRGAVSCQVSMHSWVRGAHENTSDGLTELQTAIADEICNRARGVAMRSNGHRVTLHVHPVEQSETALRDPAERCSCCGDHRCTWSCILGCDFSICQACFSKHAAKDIDSSADSSAAFSSKGDLLTMAADEPVALTIETPAAPSRSDAGEAKESKAPINPEQPSVDTERAHASHRHAQQADLDPLNSVSVETELADSDVGHNMRTDAFDDAQLQARIQQKMTLADAGGDDVDEKGRITVYDFAGQQMYYLMHHIMMTSSLTQYM
jgi:hypothetical protein